MITLKTYEGDLKEYPPGVPFLDYAAGPRPWWAFNDGGDETLLALQKKLNGSRQQKYLKDNILISIHESTLLTTQPTGNIQSTQVRDFATAVLLHLAKHVCASHMPVNCRDWLDIFQYPIVAWRLVPKAGGGEGHDKEKVKVCLHVGLKHSRGEYKAGDILEYGHEKRYRQLVLGFDKNNNWVAQPVHALINILRDGPWKLDANKDALMVREGLSRRELGGVNRIECMHLHGCQASGSCHCIGPFCTTYGSRSRNKAMAREYASTVGLRQRLHQKFSNLDFVTVARNVAKGGAAHAMRMDWLDKQGRQRAVRAEAVARHWADAAVAAAAELQRARDNAASAAERLQAMQRAAARGAMGGRSGGRRRGSAGRGGGGAATPSAAAAAGTQMQTRSRSRRL